MSLSVFFRLILLPVLFPLTVVYGIFACVIKLINSCRGIKLNSLVVSVGNFCVGGSGKTPVVGELVKFFESKGYKPVIISKSYKASLSVPAEVKEGADPAVFGDEAILLKEAFPEAFVYSGPQKYQTAAFAEKALFSTGHKVFILDDGAQHHRIKKDLKIHVWDLSRPLLDILPFPLGQSREFWFLGETPDLTVFNRSEEGLRKSILARLVKPPRIDGQYVPVSIRNVKSGEELKSDFTLVSGLGNFKQLSKSVQTYVSDKNYSLLREIKGRDHDSFDWFDAKDGVNYVCTEKDKAKLIDKIRPENLFVVRSEFTKDFQENLGQVLNKLISEGT